MLIKRQIKSGYRHSIADAFDNAIGNSIVGKIQQTELDKLLAKQKEQAEIERLKGFVDWDKAYIDSEALYGIDPIDKLFASNELVQEDPFKQFQEGELPKERGFWDAIPHNEKPKSVETEFGFSFSGTPPLIGRLTGKIEFGWAASLAFDNYGNVAFASQAIDTTKGVGSADWSTGFNFSVLEGDGLKAVDIVYGDMVTGGPNVELLEFNKLKMFGKKLPSASLSFDYEIGTALNTPIGNQAVRGFEFGLELSSGGTRVGADVTYQHSPAQNITSNWGVVGQLFWAHQHVSIKTINHFIYKGMDQALQNYANPEQPQNNLTKKDK